MTDNRKFLNLLAMGKLTYQEFEKLKEIKLTKEFLSEFLRLEQKKQIDHKILCAMTTLIVDNIPETNVKTWLGNFLEEIHELNKFHKDILSYIKRQYKTINIQKELDFYAI